ncbi:hypothetical protein IGS67_07780 [Flavimobilis sp. GY10621]|uniref:Protein kinase domain-containing protein n=1 Tax=Flavimobilis rhizosphaerae TaxID=2775421 RepID=A0ABR9DR52_9MICO|nr:hypothetical protein [Flavimobilis rhizosphaerae]MBD9699389.1 hypothetical protein [Flavimobilis rhizosphaerae]
MTESQVGDLIAERYRLRQRVRSDVEDVERWSAEDEILGREVLVALVSGSRATVALDEARRAALIADPRLARVLDVGQVPESPYVVTERPRGRSLEEIVDAHGPLSGVEARAVVGEVAEALAVAERRGVHHAALRPSVVHVAPGKVLVEGLGLDGALGDGGFHGSRASLPADAAGLGRLLQFALTGQRIGDVPVPRGALDKPSDDDVEAVALASIADSLLTTLTPTLRAPSAVADELAPWGKVSVPVPQPEKPAPVPLVTHVDVPAEGAVDVSDDASDVPDDVPDAGGLDGAPGAVPDVGEAGGLAAPSDAGEVDDVDTPSDELAAVEDETGSFREDSVMAADAVETAAESTSRARTSVRTMFDGSPAVPTIPGKPQPPPAASPIKRSSVLGGMAATASAASSAAVPPPVPVPAPTFAPVIAAGSVPRGGTSGGSSAAPAWDAVVGATGRPAPARAAAAVRPTSPGAGGGRGRAEDLRTVRFNPTALTLVLALVLALGGVVWAAGNLSGFRSPFQWGSNARPVPTDSTGEPQATATTTVPPVLPAIASVQQLDPDGDENEHPEAASRAIDLDPTTYWFSRTYRSATFAGMGKRGIGIAVSLEKPAPVSTVYIQSNSTGGRMQVRVTDPSKPDEGTVLYEGPVDKDMEIDVATPVEAEHVVLWFTELPQTSGQNRAEIREISVS